MARAQLAVEVDASGLVALVSAFECLDRLLKSMPEGQVPSRAMAETHGRLKSWLDRYVAGSGAGTTPHQKLFAEMVTACRDVAALTADLAADLSTEQVVAPAFQKILFDASMAFAETVRVSQTALAAISRTGVDLGPRVPTHADQPLVRLGPGGDFVRDICEHDLVVKGDSAACLKCSAIGRWRDGFWEWIGQANKSGGGI